MAIVITHITHQYVLLSITLVAASVALVMVMIGWNTVMVAAFSHLAALKYNVDYRC